MKKYDIVELTYNNSNDFKISNEVVMTIKKDNNNIKDIERFDDLMTILSIFDLLNINKLKIEDFSINKKSLDVLLVSSHIILDDKKYNYIKIKNLVNEVLTKKSDEIYIEDFTISIMENLKDFLISFVVKNTADDETIFKVEKLIFN
jgi:hypothetical protein